MSKLKVSKRWHWPLLVALFAALLASGQDNKRQETSPSQSAATKGQKAAPSVGGIRVFIDPITGAIREPTPEELQALSTVPSSAASGLQTLTHRSGAVGLVLGEDQTVRATGKLNEKPQTAAIDSEGPQLLTHPSGAEGILLGEDQMVYSVATIGPDGKLKMDCITGKNNAETKVKAPPRKEASDVR